MRHGRVLGADLAPAGQLEHQVGAGPPGALGRLVAAPVAGHDQLEALARVVEPERVGHLGGDHLLLVVGGDDQRQRGQLRARHGVPPRGSRTRPAQPGHERQRQPVADLRPHEQRTGEPEQEREQGHGSIRSHRAGISQGRPAAGGHLSSEA